MTNTLYTGLRNVTHFEIMDFLYYHFCFIYLTHCPGHCIPCLSFIKFLKMQVVLFLWRQNSFLWRQNAQLGCSVDRKKKTLASVFKTGGALKRALHPGMKRAISFGRLCYVSCSFVIAEIFSPRSLPSYHHSHFERLLS